MASISQCLQEHFPQGQYDSLYTPQGGYLIYGEGCWKVTRNLTSKNKDEAYKALSIQLETEGLAGVAKPESLVCRINFFFMHKMSSLPVIPSDLIRFNSHQEGFEFLSNFYPTLIVDSKGKVYSSSEHYYHFQMIKKCSLPDEDPTLPPPGSEPIKWKKWGESVQKRYLAAQADPRAEEDLLRLKEKGMEVVIKKKFEQNPILCNLLIQTHPHKLQELSSSDSFFGANDQGQGQNKLGYILMSQRDSFISSL
jgi:ribA/ribD-fused uncharacterized protein